MKCEICKRGMESGVNLHRQNEKGVKGVWRCDDCNLLPLDPKIQDICKILNPKAVKRVQ